MKISGLFVTAVDYLGTIIFSIITVVSFAQIINRYFFGNSFVFAEELAVQLMIWIAFLGAAKCVRENAHTRMTVILNMAPPTIRSAMRLLADALCVAFLSISAWYGFGLVKATWRGTTTGTHIPEGLVYLAMPFCSIIMILFFVAHAVETVRHFGAEREDVRP